MGYATQELHDSYTLLEKKNLPFSTENVKKSEFFKQNLC